MDIQLISKLYGILDRVVNMDIRLKSQVNDILERQSDISSKQDMMDIKINEMANTLEEISKSIDQIK